MPPRCSMTCSLLINLPTREVIYEGSDFDKCGDCPHFDVGDCLFHQFVNERTFGQDSGSPNGQIQTQKPEWLDGSGKDLCIKVTGKVFDENGTTANGYKLEARLETSSGERPAFVIEGNRFEFWVPVGTAGWWFTLYVNATSADGGQIARK